MDEKIKRGRPLLPRTPQGALTAEILESVKLNQEMRKVIRLVIAKIEVAIEQVELPVQLEILETLTSATQAQAKGFESLIKYLIQRKTNDGDEVHNVSDMKSILEEFNK